MQHPPTESLAPTPQDEDPRSESLAADRQELDVMDEQRSDDDGMPEHADKAAAESAARPLASVLKREILAAEYHARASQASALAAASPLDRVREKHEAAADRWRLLAALNERDRRMAPAEAPATHLDPVA